MNAQGSYASSGRVADDVHGDVPRVLLVEDDRSDFLYARRLLSEVFGSDLRIDWLKDWQTAVEAAQLGDHDVCLIDYDLGARTGLDLIRELKSTGVSKPLILLTGHNHRKIDLEAMEAGATDYLVKEEITSALLDRSIRYAIERKNTEDKLTSLAERDLLTGLPNRYLFNKRLLENLKHTKRAVGELCAVLLLDLNKFKDVNDTLGHPAGDHLLSAVSKRLLDCTRETDTVSRLGGDEFAIIAPHLKDTDSAAVLAEKIHEVIREPFDLDGHQIEVSCSIGISLYPNDAKSVEELLKFSDLALYRSKREGAGQYRYFNEQMFSDWLGRKKLEDDLSVAVKQRQFVLHYQPKVDLKTGCLRGVEALVRWQRPNGDLVSPYHFIQATEDTGLIVELGDWVLEEACRQSVSWRDDNLHIPVAVNLSPVQFKRSNVVDLVSRTIDSTGIAADQIELEITEGTIIDNWDSVSNSLDVVAEWGVKIAIDDFGTGHSSLAYLQKFPVHKIKIDRSFVQDCEGGGKPSLLAAAIVKLGHCMGLTVVAEGIETEAQRAYMCAQKCDEIQGYLISRPMPAERIPSWITEHHP